MIAAGIIDPTKVTRSALQNAASIAALFLTTEAVVADKPEKASAPAARRHAAGTWTSESPSTTRSTRGAARISGPPLSASQRRTSGPFAETGTERVWATAMAVNTPSRRVLERVGLRHVRTYHEHFDDPIPGTEQGEVEYAVTRSEWRVRSRRTG